MRTRLLFEILFYCLMLLWGTAMADIQQANASRQKPVVVMTVRGQVEILEAGHELVSWRAVNPGENLQENSVLAIGREASACDLVLPDATIMHLSPGSLVQIMAMERKILVKSGNVIFHHPQRGDKHSPYQLFAVRHIPCKQVQLSQARTDNQ